MSSLGMVFPFVSRRAPGGPARFGLLDFKIRAASQTRVPDWVTL